MLSFYDVNDKKNNAAKNHQRYDKQGTMKKEGIRQDINDRVGIRIKQPVIIMKEKLVEYHKGPIKINHKEQSCN